MIGRSIDHYVILEKMPGGAMGVVYRARDEKLRRDVALKLLPPGTLDDLISRQRLRREALALSRLSHPAVAVLHDFVSTPEHDCIVMEFVVGDSLDEIIHRGALGERETLRLGVQLAQGLAAAHAAGVIHRDLKPGNLRVTPDGWLKILDFGLAKRAPHGTESWPTESMDPQGIAGTAAFVAPEVWGGAPASEASDVYAAGVVLYEMATGAHPFRDLASRGFAHAALSLNPPTPRSRNPAISPELDSVIRRCMEKDPSRRMSSAKELAQVLEGLSSSQSSATADARPRRTRRWMVGIGVVSIALVVYAVGAGWGWWPAPGTATTIRSLAVLPVANFTGDSAHEDMADGITDGLISNLGEYRSIRVIDRTTMMTYKRHAKTLPTVARELRVGGMIQGSLKRSRDRLEFSFQLIRGHDGHQMWSKHYKGDLGEAPDIQDRAARAIAREIGLSMGRGDRAGRSHETQVDPAAYNLYLQGRSSWNRRSEEGVRQAIACFTAAIAKDSLYAPAHSGLADAWTTASHLGVAVPLEAYPRAKQAALRALAIDSSLSDAYVSLANIRQNFDWDWEGAERDFERAIELNPSNSEAHHWYANLLAYRGEFDRATAEIERAKAVDPRSLPVNIGGAALLYFARRHQEAFRDYQRVAEIDSSSGLLYRAIAGNLYQMGRHAEAARAIRRWMENEHQGDLARRAADEYRSAGLRGMVRVLLGALEAGRRAGRYVPATHLAELSILLGDREGAFRWLATALAEHDSEMNRLKVDPVYDPLRADPRFQDLLRRIGLGPSA